jgi:signal transduction histidine kinase
MDRPVLMSEQGAIPEFLSGGGEMGQRIREFDWSATPLGPVHTWPQSLRTCVRIMLTSRQPIWISWGKEHIKLYNDPYKAIVGGKHPQALGQPASIVWKEIWKDVVGPLLHKVMEKDEGSYMESQLLIMERNGYAEETYYTFSYTPIPGDDGGTAGMICFNTDDTEKITSERQLRSLTQLGNLLTGVQYHRQVIERTISTLQENPWDFPFALFYTINDRTATLFHSTDPGQAIASIPIYINLQDEEDVASVLRQAVDTRQLQVLDAGRLNLDKLPRGVWEVPASKAIVLPIVQTGSKDPYGLLVVGLNPYRLPDEKYTSFLSLIADQVANSFGEVHVLEEERKRTEALAALDRAKTTFFSNISHEFRTPLTLLLGPIEETLNSADSSEETRYRMEVAYRNALRMQKLVNTLLEFSRIEAGRVEGRFSKVDIVSFTRDLVSLFRAAVEKTGMQLHFHGGPVHDEVYVDSDMWEKIVLNLVSNAFKYTREGSIEVNVTQVDGQVQLAVKDTGTGIPQDQLEKIFDRFHRVENRDGRSQEGTGIGLAMVKELVRFHQGGIHVASAPGRGSVFTVGIPVGKAHLQPDRIIHTMAPAFLSGNTVSFVEEALKWVPIGVDVQAPTITNGQTVSLPRTTGDVHRIVLADDNADMREYIYRLLSDQFEVIMAVDGEDAFAKVLHYKPQLLLSDIMMPRLDGFGLLQQVRNHPDLRNMPVIFLSARAGEEARVEGLDAGADDYLVKPFSAKELLATVRANLKVARYNQELEEEVKKRTAELFELNTMLQQSNNDLQQFAHVASHDLKEPLRKIKTFSGRLEADPATVLSEKSQQYLEKVHSATNRMFNMIDGVLNYSMINATEQDKGFVSLQDVIRSIESDLELLIQQKGAIIEYLQLPEIEGAPVLLHQLFYNLLNNALKFSKDGVTPLIHISATIIFEDGKEYAAIEVQDNGIGFEPQFAEKIFHTFARLNSKDQYEGTGLGLSLCRKIVQRHGGSIQATGKKGEGAVFSLRLPVKQQDQQV